MTGEDDGQLNLQSAERIKNLSRALAFNLEAW
jgi:hypothetical protein